MKCVQGWIFFIIYLTSQASSARTHQNVVSEQQTKLSDLAALSLQDQSIQKLKSLVKQYQGSQREPELLSRLADLYLERSGISFRISEGTSVKNKSPLYQQSLNEAIQSLGRLIRQYPYHAHAPLAHFKRGKAYKELKQVTQAKEDFLYLEQHQPEFAFLDSALIDLADFAQDANQHVDALSYLSKIEKMPKSEYLPIALHKSAWSYFNLGSYESGIHYLEKEMNYYFNKLESKKTTASAESAFLESAFNDLALFNFEAINKKAEFASVDQALKTFEKLDLTHQYFGQTVLKFAKLLKAYTLIPELDRLRQKLVQNQKQSPETSEVVLILFQFHFDRRDFNRLSSLIADLKVIQNEKTEAKIEQALSRALADLHQLVLKNKLATERGTLIRPLIALTESTGDLLGKNNLTALLANYSLAETLFELKEFTKATRYYQDLLRPEFESILSSKKLDPTTLKLRLLSSRYQEMLQLDLIPKQLKVKTLTSGTDPVSQEQKKLMIEWLSWLDDASKNLKTATDEKSSLEAFELEGLRLGYLYFDTEKSVQNLITFGLTHSETKDGITALTLALDTLSLSESYSRVFELSELISKQKSIKDQSFISKTNKMGSEAHLKITFETKDQNLVLNRTEFCLRDFKDTKVLNECRAIHAKTLLQLEKYTQAEEELTHLLSVNQDANHFQSFLLLRADARNKMGQLKEAIQDLDHYQKLTHYSDVNITEQILEYAWFRNDQNHLQILIRSPEVCQGKNKSHCEQYQVVQLLEKESKITYLTAFKNTLKAAKEVQSLWALIALKNPKNIAFQDRLILLQRLSQSWEQLNPLLQIRIFPLLLSEVSLTLESIRISAPSIAPLSPENDKIERRMRLMQDIDLTFAKVMKLNWLDLKQKGATELGLIYEGLIQELKQIQTPENLLSPFHQKVNEIKTAKQNLESMAIEFSSVNRTPAESTHSAEGYLTSSTVRLKIPSHLWNEWEKAVSEKRRDYLFHLVSIFETQDPTLLSLAPTLKGLILVLGGAATEAHALIESAPDSPFKNEVLAHFKRRMP